MPRLHNFVYTDLTAADVLTLVVDDVTYEVTQFSSSWACNEIPKATCMLAVGRNARTQVEAAIHANARRLQMQEATVWFSPGEEYSLDSDWPAARPLIIFDGYFTGFSFRKISGKIHVVANLEHWLAGLGMSSSLTRNGHVRNPTQMNAAAVLQSLGGPQAGLGSYISELVPMSLVDEEVERDLWSGIKSIFCALASTPTLPVNEDGICGGAGVYRANDFALAALNRIEGFIPDPPAPGAPVGCSTDYVWGVPLAMDTVNTPEIAHAIALSVGQETIASYAGTSFWDKLIGQFCPMFGMAVVPMIDSAVIIADTPTLRGAVWKNIAAADYDSHDMTAEAHRLLHSVGVMMDTDSPTQASTEDPSSLTASGGGCFVEDSVAPGDGMSLFVAAPYWLRSLRTLPTYTGHNSGLIEETSNVTATTLSNPLNLPPPPPGTFGTAIETMYQRYAHLVYVSHALSGRSGTFSGKLRFDIAPGSIVALEGTTERFSDLEQDKLGVTLIGCVQRVTITINAEAAIAGTSFLLSHLRSEVENTLDRTSVTRHPLFGNSIHGGGKHGCPLKDEYDLP